jgi:hypothetical protein
VNSEVCAIVQAVSHQPVTLRPRSVYVGFVMDIVTLGQVVLQVLQFLPVNIVPPWLRTPISSTVGLLVNTRDIKTPST